MKAPLFTLSFLLVVGLAAQKATSIQPEYYSAYKLAERLPGGEIVTVLQTGGSAFESYPTLTVLAPSGDTLWSLDFNTIGAGLEFYNLFPLTDTSFIVHGRVHECDINDGAFTVFHTITGERLFDATRRPWSGEPIPRTLAGCRLSSGNILLLRANSYLVLSPEFEYLSTVSLEEDPILCGWAPSNIIAGTEDNILLIDDNISRFSDCSPRIIELKIDSSLMYFSDTIFRFQRRLYTDGVPLAIAQKDTFSYIFTDRELLKTNQSFWREAAVEFPSTATSAIIEFGEEDLFVLYQTDEDYQVTRFSINDLRPLDTFSLDYVPGLTYHDFYISNDSLYAFGELMGYEVEYSYLRDAVAVRTVAALGEGLTLPDTDLEVEILTGGEARVQEIDPPLFSFNCPDELYSVSYPGLSVRVTNAGTVPITEFFLHTKVNSACSGWLCSATVQWRHRFTGLNIPPGDMAELPLDNVVIGERSGEYQLCLWAANVNGGIEKDHGNNAACYDFVNPISDPHLSMEYRLFPERSAGLLNLKTDDLRPFGTKVYDVNGRLVGAAAGAGEVKIAMPSARGVYFVVVTEDGGRSQTFKAIW